MLMLIIMRVLIIILMQIMLVMVTKIIVIQILIIITALIKLTVLVINNKYLIKNKIVNSKIILIYKNNNFLIIIFKILSNKVKILEKFKIMINNNIINLIKKNIKCKIAN